MLTEQLSVFLENKKGRLFAAADVLAAHGINIRALSLADTAEYGILRLIVDQPEKGKEILTNAGIVVRVTKVIALPMEDVPGGSLAVLRLLSEQNINVEYMYASVSQQSGKAFLVLQVDDRETATEALKKAGFDGCVEF